MTNTTQNTIARQRVYDALDAQRRLCDDTARERSDWRRAAADNALERMGELVEAGYYADAKRISIREFEVTQ